MSTRRTFWLSILLLFVAATLRFGALAQAGRFHPDEALFATFARSAALNGDWLLPGALDKPPLSIYATALSMALLVDGEAAPGLPDISPRMGEFAARIPNLFISLIVVALSGRLAWTLYRSRRVGLLTLALAAFAPYGVAFGPTAFTDGWLLLWLVAALTAIAGGRWSWAGLWLGLAFWSKQQALFTLPLVLLLGGLVDTRPELWRRAGRFALVFAGLAALLAVWDAARTPATSLWALAAANNDPWRLARSDEVWPRLRGWLADAGWLMAHPPVTTALSALGVGAALVRAVRQPRRLRVAVDVALLTFSLGYVGLHWLVAFNLYDRYLLLVLVPLALLCARGLDALLVRMGDALRLAAVAALAGLLVWAGVDAAQGRAPIGADRGAHDGIDAAAAFLDRQRLGAIVYDYWLGWELDYYLGEWTDKRRVYYPSTGALAADALRQPDAAPRYFIAPADAPFALWLDALTDAGFAASSVYDADGNVIYELLPPWADS